MKAILVHLEDAEHQAVKQAARLAGLKQKELCRRAVVDMAKSITGSNGHSILDLVREIHKSVCQKPSLAGEAEDAATVLIQMGISETTARRRTAKITAANPEATAAEIVKESLKCDS